MFDFACSISILIIFIITVTTTILIIQVTTIILMIIMHYCCTLVTTKTISDHGCADRSHGNFTITSSMVPTGR